MQALLDMLVAFWIFTGCLVFVEPSPYEVSFLLVLPVAFMAGMGLYRSTLGLLLIFIGFIPFALIGAFQVRIMDVSDALIFVIVTIFLLLTAYFVANYVAENTEKRMRLIMGAYTFAALLSAVIGTLAYLRLMPAADMFLLYGRAKAMFNDPNVFGPFLVLPAMYALQRVLLGTGRRAFWAGVDLYGAVHRGLRQLFARRLGAFRRLPRSSRWCCASGWRRGRMKRCASCMLSLLGLGMLVVALGGLLSIPSVASFFETRTAEPEL